MDFRKLVAGGSLVFLLTGCQLWDQIAGTASQISGDKASEEIVMDAFSKMQNDVKKVHTDLSMNLTINAVDPEGTIVVNLAANEDQDTLKEKGSLDFSFSMNGAVKDAIAKDGGPESGLATVNFVRENFGTYFKVADLKLEPEQMNSFVEMFLPDVTKNWYYLDLSKMKGMEGIDLATVGDMTLADAIATSIVTSSEDSGTPISKEAAKEIASKLLSGAYLEVTGTQTVGNDVVYTTKIDYEGLKKVAKEVVEIIARETGEAPSTEEEINSIIDQVKDATSDLLIDIAINNQGYISNIKSNFDYNFKDEQAKSVKSISVIFEMYLSKYNEDFEISVPTEYQDITSMVESMNSTAESDYNFDSEMGFADDFYPCDIYGCKEESENRVVDNDGAVWTKVDGGQWTVAQE